MAPRHLRTSTFAFPSFMPSAQKSHHIYKGRGIDLFREVCERNLEGIVAKEKTGIYSTVSGWLKIKNPLYTQFERRHELFDSFKAKQTKQLPPIPKKSPVRSRPLCAT